MSRFLLVVPPLVGHINPLVGVAAELRRRGHEVAWCGHASVLERVLGSDAEIVPLEEDRRFRHELERTRTTPKLGLASVRFFFDEVAIPLARHMLPAVEQVIRDLEPDIVLSDQHAMAGALAARRLGVPLATSAPSAAVYASVSSAMLPQVQAWIAERLGALEIEVGLAPTPTPAVSDRLVLVHTTASFAGYVEVESPASFVFIGSTAAGRDEPAPFPWAELVDRPRVLVSLGTVSGAHGRRFFDAAMEGLAESDVQLLVADPTAEHEGVRGNALVRRWVPFLELLDGHVDVLVGHAGGNTIHEAMLHAVPLVLAPVRDDQGVFADRAVAVGVAVRIRYGRSTPAQIREAVLEVLSTPSYREAAARMKRELAAAGGAEAAVDALEELGSGGYPPPDELRSASSSASR